jgi:methyl-accepting chemotaxis protein
LPIEVVVPTVSAVAARAQRLGLFWALIGVFTAALLVLVLVLFIVVPAQVDEYLTDTLSERGRQVAKEVRRRLRIGVRSAVDLAESEEISAIVAGEPEIHSVWALICPEVDCRPRDVVAMRAETEPRTTEVVLRQFNSARQPAKLALEDGDLLVADPFSTTVDGAAARAFVLVSLERGRIDQGLARLRRTLLAALVVSALVFITLIGVLSRTFIIRPIRGMQAMAGRLSEADLSGRLEPGGTRELDELAVALNSIGQGLRDTLGRVRGVAESVAQVIDQLSRSAATSSTGSNTVLTRVEETSTAMGEMLTSLKGIAEHVDELFHSAEDSSASIQEMATTNDEVAQSVGKMSASVEQTTSAIEEMTYSIKEVANSVGDLLENAEVTSSSIRAMDGTITQVESNAYETARLSEQVSKDSEIGMESIQKTITGIDKIRDSSVSAAKVIEKLGGRIQEIGNIVDVIDEVAEQTNLLALNAAIIAAQAGEHGKGFAVVADEIKDLAERTGASTKEIAELIRAVQGESRNAVSAMSAGVRSVDDGVLLGRETEGALKKIHDSAHRSTQMVKAIARATVEQAKSSREVTAGVERIRETVEQINKATKEQAAGSEQIMKSAEHMKLLTSHVNQSVQEQAHGSKQISRSIESITEMVTHLNRAQKDQTRNSEQVLKAVETIKAVADTQNRSVKQLEEAVETLRQQSEVLRGEIRRFRM